MADTKSVNVDQQGAVRVLQLDNPARSNALSLGLYAELTTQLATADRDPAVRALVITGGPSCFCSGNDLDDFLTGPTIDKNHPAILFMEALRAFSKPVVAAVEGAAVGIGTTMLLHCDLVYAGRSAFLQMPFVQLGICPEYASSYLLPRLMGYQRAAELLLLGDRISAEQGRTMGLINQTLADGVVLSHVLKVAQRLAAAPPKSMREAKRLMTDSQRAGVTGALEAEMAVLAEAVDYGELAEAITAIREKRTPDFSRFE